MMKNFAKKLLVAAGIAAAGFAAYALFSDDKSVSVVTSTENGQTGTPPAQPSGSRSSSGPIAHETEQADQQAAEGTAIDAEFREVKSVEDTAVSSLNPSAKIAEPISEET